MQEIEDALRILDLKPGASLKQVVEARDDLLALWNPDRLANAPRLRSKAPDKLREIHEAYEVLMRHLGEPATAGGSSAYSGGSGASLYEEVFSKSKPTVPLWLIVVLSVVLVVAGLYLSQFLASPEKEPAPVEGPAEPPSQAEPPPAAGPETTPTVGDSASSETSPTPAPVETAAAPTPAPPPETAVSKAVSPPRQGPKPLLKRKVIGSEGAQEDADEEQGTSPSAQRQEQAVAEKAFQDLLANSESARNLAKGQFWNLRFDHWQVVQQTDSEVWIDMVALRPNGTPIHHIWAVRVADGVPRPLSEAARDLEHNKPGAESGR